MIENIQHILYICLGIYSTIILILRDSLFNDNKKIKNKKTISVIVAVKNGENSISQLLNQLHQQKDINILEFLIVDDNSNDNTKHIIKKYSDLDPRFVLLSSNQGNTNLKHKKRALDAGIKSAKGEILLFTDVDCQVPDNWSKQISSKFFSDIHYVVGYSEVPSSKNIITLFQKIDLFMLMNTAHSTLNKNWYWASSGQNQSYLKEIFTKNKGFNEISNCLQGDDTLFFQICRKNIKDFKSTFAFDPQNKVYCRQEKTLYSFIMQRIRWAGDALKTWKFNKYFFCMSIITFFTNSIIFLNSFFIILNYITIFQFIIPILIKFIIEYSFALKGMKTHNDNYNIFQFSYWFIFQPLYIITIGIGSFFQNHLLWRESR